ncbi:MAG: CAP domain-containing protein [Candidatus Binataceae bacterium]
MDFAATERRGLSAKPFSALAISLCLLISARAAQPQTAHGAASSAPSPASGAWLLQINRYRKLAGLDPVQESGAMSAGDLNHAKYLVKNFETDLAAGTDTHAEKRDAPGYTASGAAAALLSNVAVRTRLDQSADPDAETAEVIDDWMIEPFQRLGILDPDLLEVGLGTYRDGSYFAVVLQIRKSPPQEGSVPAVGGVGEYLDDHWPAQQSPKYPIMFPPDGSQVSLRAYEGGEWPDPIAPCGASGSAAGLPITLELGPDVHAGAIAGHLLTADGVPLRHCVFDASTYAAPDMNQAMLGKADLEAFGTVVLVPREPLRPDTTYTVSIALNGKEYKWSFSVK